MNVATMIMKMLLGSSLMMLATITFAGSRKHPVCDVTGVITADCSGRHLSHVPSDLHQNITRLDLHNNNITLNINYIQMMLITLYSQVKLVA